MQYLTAVCNRPEATSDVISGRFVGPVVPDKSVKFGDPRLNLSRDITPEAVLGGIFDVFCCNFRPEVVSDVVSGANVGQVGMDVHAKFCDSGSNGSQDIRLPHIVTNDDDDGHHIRAKHLNPFCLKKCLQWCYSL